MKVELTPEQWEIVRGLAGWGFSELWDGETGPETDAARAALETLAAQLPRPGI